MSNFLGQKGGGGSMILKDLKQPEFIFLLKGLSGVILTDPLIIHNP